MKLIPIKYHNLKYPNGITPTIEEIAGHFDITTIKSKLYNKPQDYEFSLHTEYSAGARKLNSSIVNKYPEIFKNVYNTNKGKIPKLWVSKKWAEEFALFIIDILNGAKPKIIEIHPPTTRRDISFNTFLDYYEIFKYTLEKNGLTIDTEHTIILLENRNGWNRQFLLTYIKDFINLSEIIDCRESDLRLILDFPQLLNIHKAKCNPNELLNVLNGINNFKHNVKAIHLWGQCNGTAHMGDMSDYFNQNQTLKDLFFIIIYNIFQNKKFLYFIPEINWGNGNKTANQCLQNIIDDLKNVGFNF